MNTVCNLLAAWPCAVTSWCFFMVTCQTFADWGVLNIKNNTHLVAHVWMNGFYQGYVPGRTTKYMPAEGFVTADSGWQKDGTLLQKESHGGWTPRKTVEFLAITRDGDGKDAKVTYWEGIFTSQVEEAEDLNVWIGEGEAINDVDIELAEQMPKGSGGNLLRLIREKTFLPSEPQGGALRGGSLNRMEESKLILDDSKFIRPPYTIGIRRVADEEYILQLIDGVRKIKQSRFANNTTETEPFIEEYVPETNTLYLIVTWVGDRPGGSPPELSDIWINVNGTEYHYDQETGLDWNNGAYGEAIRIRIRKP